MPDRKMSPVEVVLDYEQNPYAAVYVFNRALTPQEIQRLYAATCGQVPIVVEGLLAAESQAAQAGGA